MILSRRAKRLILTTLVIAVPVIALAVPLEYVDTSNPPKSLAPFVAMYLNVSGQAVPVSAANPLPTSGGGSGGDATAANQATQITQETTTATGVGAPADAAYAGSGSSSIISALKGIYAGVSSALPAGTNLIGKVGIDQTTPGATNAVSATNFPTTAALGHGTAATALRVELPTDGTGTVALGTGSNVIGVTGVAQNSTTSGQSGPLVQGAVATAAPTYTTAQTAPLSLSTGGALRTTLTSGSGTIAMQSYTSGGTANASGVGVSGVYLSTPPTLTNSQAVGFQMDAKGNLRVAPGGLASSLNVTSATNVKSGAGRVYRVILNTVGSTASSIIDSTGTSVTAANTLLTIPSTAAAGTVFNLEFPFQAGLSVVPGTSAVLAVSYD